MGLSEDFAEVLRQHAYVPSGLRGVSRCACGEEMRGMPHDHRAHVAAILAARAADDGLRARVEGLCDLWDSRRDGIFTGNYEADTASAGVLYDCVGDFRAALAETAPTAEGAES